MSKASKSEASRSRRQRGTISADQIIHAAFDLARDIGVDGLTMPKLAASLDIGVASIYWYFRSKEELLDELTVEATRQFHAGFKALPTNSWDELTLAYFRRFRTVLRSDDVMSDLVLFRSAPFLATSLDQIWPQIELVLQAHVDAGFTLQESVDNYFSLSLYARGIVILDRQQRSGGSAPTVPVRLPVGFNSERFPLLAEASAWHSLRGTTDAEFEGGLQTMVQGMRSRLDAAKRHDAPERAQGTGRE